jgi:O-antigen ligase
MTQQRLSQGLDQASRISLWLFAAVTLLSIAAQNVIFVGLAAWLAAAFVRGNARQALAPRAVFIPYLLFLLWALLAAASSENAGHSLFTWRRWLLAVIAWYAGSAIEDQAQLKGLLKALLLFSGLWCLGASLVSLSKPLAFAQSHPWPAVMEQWAHTGLWRAASGSGGYMILGTGSMMLLLLFTSLMLSDPSWRKPLYFACMASMALALMLTLVRSAWFGLGAGLFALLLFRKPLYACLLVMAVLAGILAFPHSLPMQRLHQGVDMGEDSTRERVYMARAGLGMIEDHPWLGVGDCLESWQRTGANGLTETVKGYYLRYQPAVVASIPTLAGKEEGHMHDDFIMLAVLAGIPGLLLMLAFFAWMGSVAWPLARASDPLAAGLAAGWLAVALGWWVNGVLEFNFTSAQSCGSLWFFTGLMLAAGRMAAVRKSGQGRGSKGRP